ncbi:MAG: ABC transporter transmembrane domain-containing protein [Chloroflexi bacterium]|nr:ABC transporter transmembrane domain-containing protein [Chloroflexota bacterium]
MQWQRIHRHAVGGLGSSGHCGESGGAGCAAIWAQLSSAVAGERMERDMREELYVSLLGKSMTFHDMQPVGDTMARATNDVHELNLMVYPGLNLVIGSLNFMIMPLLLAPRYDLALVLAPLFFIITYILALIHYMRTLDPLPIRCERRLEP